VTLRNPLGVMFERAAKKRDPRWQWRAGAMELWTGFDLYYVPPRAAFSRWLHRDWSLW